MSAGAEMVRTVRLVGKEGTEIIVSRDANASEHSADEIDLRVDGSLLLSTSRAFIRNFGGYLIEFANLLDAEAEE
jgi:hypothetical protein